MNQMRNSECGMQNERHEERNVEFGMGVMDAE